MNLTGKHQKMVSGIGWRNNYARRILDGRFPASTRSGVQEHHIKEN
jgi:hypothetical protein